MKSIKKMKERREQPKEKTNSPMITSAKNYTKKEQKTDRTLGQMVKAKVYRQNHTKKHTHTHSQKVKKEKIRIYIYFCSQSPPPQFSDNSLSFQVFHRCGVHQVDCGDLICCS